MLLQLCILIDWMGTRYERRRNPELFRVINCLCIMSCLLLLLMKVAHAPQLCVPEAWLHYLHIPEVLLLHLCVPTACILQSWLLPEWMESQYDRSRNPWPFYIVRLFSITIYFFFLQMRVVHAPRWVYPAVLLLLQWIQLRFYPNFNHRFVGFIRFSSLAYDFYAFQTTVYHASFLGFGWCWLICSLFVDTTWAIIWLLHKGFTSWKYKLGFVFLSVVTWISFYHLRRRSRDFAKISLSLICWKGASASRKRRWDFIDVGIFIFVLWTIAALAELFIPRPPLPETPEEIEWREICTI